MARLHGMHGTDDGYFFVDSGHKGLGINKEAIKVAQKKQAEIEELKRQLAQSQQAAAAPAAPARNWLLWGGLALGVAVAAGLVWKKRKGGAA